LLRAGFWWLCDPWVDAGGNAVDDAVDDAVGDAVGDALNS
jgi:hypothetical protein